MNITISKLLEQKFRTAFKQLGLDDLTPVVLKESSRPEFGDYQVNGVIGAAKKLQQNPRDLAAKIVSKVDQEGVIEKLEIAGPGFINITLAKDYLDKNLNENLLQVRSDWLEKVVIDYSSPNLAKEMHVGHLRSTIIGDALVRMHEFLGDEVIRRNHVGDWGTQFGMLVAYLLDTDSGLKNLELELSDLEEFYRKAKARFDEDQAFADRAREYVVKLQANDPEVILVWEKFIEVSLNHCQKIYDRLGVKLTPKDAIGESAYNAMLPVVVKKLVEQGIATKSDGAICVFFTSDELGSNDETPFIIQKKDGAYLYATTDIAALCDRVDDLKSNHLIYVIDARQALHLRQLFATAKKAGWVSSDIKLEHVAFGVMLGEDNKPFKTRAGGTVKLSALIDEAVSRAKLLIKERNAAWDKKEIDGLAESLGIAAVKYSDLSKNRSSDYVFSFDQMLSFEGNTAPYMLYAYVRIISIFRKVGLNINNYLDRSIKIKSEEEHRLAVHLIKFADRVLQATKDSQPHQICAYLYDLAGLFMRFYEACPIMQTKEQDIKNSRLALGALTAKILEVGLKLLGINVVERM